MGDYRCFACFLHYKDGLAYNCSLCNFNLDLKCASNWSNILENDCHDHEFTVLVKQLQLCCDACGQGGHGVSYLCSVCQLLCCNYIAHASCSTHKDFRDETTLLEKENHDPTHITIETVDDESKSLILGDAKEMNMEVDQIELELGAAQIKHFSHDHFLVLIDEVKDHDDTITSDGCMRSITITEAFYSCTEQEECHFFFHKSWLICLERCFTHFTHTSSHSLLGLLLLTVCFGVLCAGRCAKDLYYCKRYDLLFDLQCISLSNLLTHEAREHNPLIFNRVSTFLCKGCSISRDNTACFSCFRCTIFRCNLHLCIQCVKLPLTTKHKYDSHPLKLTYHNVEDDEGESCCQICKGKRNPKDWFYYCKKCDFDCHPDCVLGRYPQVKLEGRYKHDAHPHLVTLVDKIKSVICFDKRESILPFEACGKPFEGLVFEWSGCNVDIHQAELNCRGREIELEHFSHKNPLMFKDKQINIDSGLVFCFGCANPMLYSSNQYPHGNFTLHKSCAELPNEMQHPLHTLCTHLVSSPLEITLVLCVTNTTKTAWLTIVPNVTSTLTSNVLPIGTTLEIMTAISTNSPSF
ncbi:hypothetical protein L3X38_038341 [Prunus dulcis]|uniref:DC1 domain-containing protein n=1 Tax=Prunus dulcis TaxID=3755 RepID=A0AAD4V5D8_PRUDU|nr:hypothetical protein L3X38_038341 [Prunus dulcis]